MNKFTWGHTVSWQTPKHTTDIGLPAPSHIDYCFLCFSTLRGIEKFKTLGESCISLDLGSSVCQMKKLELIISAFLDSKTLLESVMAKRDQLGKCTKGFTNVWKGDCVHVWCVQPGLLVQSSWKEERPCTFHNGLVPSP